MSDDENPAVGGDDLMSPHELLEELDTDESGWIESDEFEKRDPIDKELDRIRTRRGKPLVDSLGASRTSFSLVV